MIYFDISEEIPFYCYNFLFLCILNNVNRYQSRIFLINTKGGGCQLTQILCIKFTSFLNSLCTIALFTSFWVTCSIFSVTNECCALIYSVDCKPFYVQIENKFFSVWFITVYHLTSSEMQVMSSVFLTYTPIFIWSGLNLKKHCLCLCPIIQFYFIKVADIFDKECTGSIMCNKYIK